MSEKRTLLGRIDQTGVPLALARLGVGGMFIFLAIKKLMDDPTTFHKAVKLYGILPFDPPELINVTAVAVPWIELVCGIALVLGAFVRGAFVLTGGMLIVFIIGLYMRTIDILNTGQAATFCDVKFDCGCGSGEEWMCTKIPTNLALLIGSVIGFYCQSRKWCLSALVFGRRKASPKTPAPQTAPPPEAAGAN